MDGKFSKRLAELRRKRGLSQKQAAADLGISQALLSHYERGIRECGLEFLLRAANYYAVSCDYLLGREHTHKESESAAVSVFRFTEAVGHKRIAEYVQNISAVFAYKLLRLVCAQHQADQYGLKGTSEISVMLADSYISLNSAKLANLAKKNLKSTDVERACADSRGAIEALVEKAEALLEQSK